MFQEIQLTNFKSFAGAADPIPLAPVTILVGANASGKSNLFDAFQFLQGVGMGLSIPELFVGKRAAGHVVFPGIRGGAGEACWSGEECFTVRAKATVRGMARAMGPEPEATEPPFEHEVTCRLRPQPKVESEVVDVHEHPAIQLTPAIPGMHFSGSHSLIAEVTGQTDVKPKLRLYASWVANVYCSVRLLQLRPSAMRSYSPLAADELGSDGENLSTIIYRICRDAKQKERYLDWLSSVCAPQVKGIEFDKRKTDDVLVMLVEGDGDEKPLSARVISDGTLRFMAILAAMFSAPEGTVFLMEEIENGLHPTRIHLLMELFEQFAESRDLQIIATTHSSQVLLSLSEKAQRDAILFARTEDTPGTITRRLGDLPHFEEVMQKTHIDHLFTTGWLEFAV